MAGPGVRPMTGALEEGLWERHTDYAKDERFRGTDRGTGRGPGPEFCTHDM